MTKVTNEAKNHMGEKEQTTFAGWKKACKAADASVWFEGDSETAQAMVGPKPYKRGETKGIGEWDGEKGSVYKSTVKESWDDKEANRKKVERGVWLFTPEGAVIAVATKQIAAELVQHGFEVTTKDNAYDVIDTVDPQVMDYFDNAQEAIDAFGNMGESIAEGKSFKRGDDDEADNKKAKDQQRKDAAKNKRKDVSEGELVETARKAKTPAYEKAYNEMKALKRELKDATGGPAKERKAIEAKIEAKQKELTELDAAIVKESMGMSDEVAAKKIADKIQGTPDLTMPKIQQYVKRYLVMVGKNETDIPHLSALVHTELEDMVTESKDDVKKLEKKVAKLQKEYADCDDFPTARHEIKDKLDAAKAELKKAKALKEGVTLKAGNLFKLLGESELLFAKRIDESKVLVTTAEGQEQWFESASLNVDPKSVRILK